MYFFMILFALLTIFAATGVVWAQSAMHSALWLVLTFLLLAVHYALLGGHLVAALQVMVYAGAIMVLVVFVIMLMGLGESSKATSKTTSKTTPKNNPETTALKHYALSSIAAALASGVLFVALFAAISGLSGTVPDLPAVNADFGTTAQIGKLLFTRYVFQFELLSLLLLAAMIGAVVLAKEAKRKLPPGRGLRAMQDRGE